MLKKMHRSTKCRQIQFVLKLVDIYKFTTNFLHFSFLVILYHFNSEWCKWRMMSFGNKPKFWLQWKKNKKTNTCLFTLFVFLCWLKWITEEYQLCWNEKTSFFRRFVSFWAAYRTTPHKEYLIRKATILKLKTFDFKNPLFLDFTEIYRNNIKVTESIK